MTVVRMALALLLAVMTAGGAVADQVPTILPSGLEELWEGSDRCGEPTAEQWVLTLEMDYRTAAQVAGEAKVIPYKFIVEDLVAAVQSQVAGGARPGGADSRQRTTTGRTSTGNSADIFGFTGHEMDRETGLVYMKGRYYDPEIGRFLTEDPAIGDPSVPPSLHEYLYAYANPTFYVDPDGNAVESIWDAISLGVGLTSLGYNLYQGNLRDAGVDTLGVLADTAALTLPFVPGGAGAAIKTSRAGTATAQQLNRARRLTRGVDTVQAVDQAVNVVDSTARAAEALDEGSFGVAAFNAGVAALGVRGTAANTSAARFGRYFDNIPNPRGPPSGPVIITESSDRVGVDLEPLFPRGRNAPSGTPSYRPGDRLPDGRIAGDGPGAALRDGPDFDAARRLPGPDINVGHIFHGEINRRGRAVGFHHSGSIGNQGRARISDIVDPPNAQRVYRANVEIFDEAANAWVAKGPASTFFPDDWSRAEVIREIRGAFGSQTLARENYFEGLSPSGVLIGGYLDSAGNINTAFPIY